MKKVLISGLVLFSFNLYADYDLGEGVSVTDAQINELKAKLPKTTEEKVFTHWTSLSNALRWSFSGGIDEGEIDFLNTPTGERQMFGPGFYTAVSETSSSSFGTTRVEVVVPAGHYELDRKILFDTLGVALTNNQLSKLGRIFPILRPISNTNEGKDWHVFNHPDLVKNVSINFDGNTGINKELLEKNSLYYYIWKSTQFSSEAQTLESLMLLSKFQDGLSYMRSLTYFGDLAANNYETPWHQFEMENFEKARLVYQKIIARSLKLNFESFNTDGTIVSHIDIGKPNMGIVSRGKFGDEKLSKEEWIKHQKENILLQFHRDFTGNQNMQYLDSLRSEGIRAGGTDAGKFIGTLSDVTTLKQNPYLEVEATLSPRGDGYLINYYYPDVAHYKKIKGRISDELYQELEGFNYEKDLSGTDNSPRRKSLNKRIIDELLTDLFDRYHGQDASLFNGKGIDLYRELISIHPRPDQNGREARAFLFAISSQLNEDDYIHMISDFDILKSKTFYKRMLKNSREPYEKLKIALVKETITSARERRSPNYSKMPEILGLLNGLSDLGDWSIEYLDEDSAELIRNRKFYQFFSKHLSEDWKYTDVEAVISSLKGVEDENIRKMYLHKVLDLNLFSFLSDDELNTFIDGIDNLDELQSFVQIISDNREGKIPELFRIHFARKVIESSSEGENIDRFVNDELFKIGLKDSLLGIEFKKDQTFKNLIFVFNQMKNKQTDYEDFFKNLIFDSNELPEQFIRSLTHIDNYKKYEEVLEKKYLEDLSLEIIEKTKNNKLISGLVQRTLYTGSVSNNEIVFDEIIGYISKRGLDGKAITLIKEVKKFYSSMNPEKKQFFLKKAKQDLERNISFLLIAEPTELQKANVDIKTIRFNLLNKLETLEVEMKSWVLKYCNDLFQLDNGTLEEFKLLKKIATSTQNQQSRSIIIRYSYEVLKTLKDQDRIAILEEISEKVKLPELRSEIEFLDYFSSELVNVSDKKELMNVLYKIVENTDDQYLGTSLKILHNVHLIEGADPIFLKLAKRISLIDSGFLRSSAANFFANTLRQINEKTRADFYHSFISYAVSHEGHFIDIFSFLGKFSMNDKGFEGHPQQLSLLLKLLKDSDGNRTKFLEEISDKIYDLVSDVPDALSAQDLTDLLRTYRGGESFKKRLGEFINKSINKSTKKKELAKQIILNLYKSKEFSPLDLHQVFKNIPHLRSTSCHFYFIQPAL